MVSFKRVRFKFEQDSLRLQTFKTIRSVIMRQGEYKEMSAFSVVLSPQLKARISSKILLELTLLI